MKVAILMSTYNGERYLQSQIDSIKNQEYKDWNLYIRDDNSNDNTREIIEQNEKIDSRIVWINKDEKDNVGVKMSFLKLMNTVNSDFYMFCDQDDIWFTDKVGKTVKRAEEYETNVPLLVHTNMTTFSDQDGIINEKVYGNKEIDEVNRILSSNSVTGCTVLINNCMKLKIKNDFANNIVMHDWWIGLCAVTMGNISYIEEPMIKYRLHGSNLVGTDTNLGGRLKRLFNYDHEIVRQKEAILQSRWLLKYHSKDMGNDKREVVETFAKLNLRSPIDRMILLRKYKFKKNSLLGDLSLWNIYAFNNKKLNKTLGD